MKFFVGLVVIGMVLFLIPTSALFSGTVADPCDDPISEDNKHAGLDKAELTVEVGIAKCDSSDWSYIDPTTLSAGQVAYHLLLTGAGDADGVFLDYNGNETWDSGEPWGDNQGSNWDFEVIGTFPVPDWEVVICGLDPAGSYNLDFKVSHWCEGSDEPEDGCIVISKVISGDLTEGSYTFKFDVYDSASGGSIVGGLSNIEITINYPADGTSKSTDPICDSNLIPGTEYYVEEVDAGGMINIVPGSGRVAVTAVESGGSYNTALFENDPQVCEGEVTVVKTVDGQAPVEGQSFDFYIWEPNGTTMGPYTLDFGNNWTLDFLLECGVGYKLWEDLASLPQGLVFGDSGVSALLK